MKIATVSDNGVTISQHFGKAPYYIVVTVEDGKITSKEKRVRGANTCACNHGAEPAQSNESKDCHGEHGHSASPESQNMHTIMANSIDDCKVLIAGGMGYGAYASLKARNLDAIVTDVSDIDQAVKLYLDGKLVNYMEQQLH